MIIVTTETLPGKKIAETLGIARGNSIRAKWFGADFISGLRSIIGGELNEYSEMMSEAREKAVAEMITDAEKLGADAIVNVRFTTSQVMQGAAEILAYGTAVKLS